jgi:putative oxidoreductase
MGQRSAGVIAARELGLDADSPYHNLGAHHIMHVFLLLTQGAQAVNAALTLNRLALGVFFAISGYHKLFNASRHATLTRTLQDDGVHAVPVMRWLLPSAEFAGGWALIIGLLSALAAFGLFVICAGAVALDAVKRIRAWQPIDGADWLGDLLYVPETLYCIGMAVVMLGGPGTWSLDAAIAAQLAG